MVVKNKCKEVLMKIRMLLLKDKKFKYKKNK